MSGVSLLDNDSSTNMLLAEEFIDDHCLYPVHEFDSEETDDSQIDTAIHEPEGVGCTDHTVELAEVLEPVVDDHNVGQPFELFPPLFAELCIRIDKNELLHWYPFVDVNHLLPLTSVSLGLASVNLLRKIALAKRRLTNFMRHASVL